MRNVLAIAELRFRGAAAARLAWLVLPAFAAAALVAAWMPGTGARVRAAAADAAALGLAGGLALLAVLVVAATAFATEVRTTVAQALLSAPVSRASVVAGGVLGHGAFGLVLALGVGAAAALGLDVGGLGARARAAPCPMTPVVLEGRAVDGLVALSRERPDAIARFVVPAGLRAGEPLRLRFAPRGRIESGYSPAGVLQVAVRRPGAAADAHRVPYKVGTGVAFEAHVPLDGLRGGDDAELVLRRASGDQMLRFPPGSVEVGGPRELFAWNVTKAVVCLLPLLLMTAAAGAAASARLAGAAALPLVLFVALLVAGRGYVEDGARFVVAAAEEAAHAEDGDHAGHDHGHGHAVEVSAAQVALARGALAILPALPDARAFWRFGDLARGSAVTGADIGRALRAGVVPCLALGAAAWLLLRRREVAGAAG